MRKKLSSLHNLDIPLIKHHTSRAAWNDAAWETLLAYCVTLKEITTLKSFLELISTPYEQRAMIRRAAVLSRLAHGHSYREIRKELFLTPQTISSLKRALDTQQYRSYRERGKTERKKKIYSPVSQTKQTRTRKHRTKFGTITIPLPY